LFFILNQIEKVSWTDRGVDLGASVIVKQHVFRTKKMLLQAALLFFLKNGAINSSGCISCDNFPSI